MARIELIGQRRLVLLIGKYAIKIPKITNFRDGWKENRRECNLSGDRRVCPVLRSFCYSLVIVMPRADRLATSEEWENLNWDEWCDLTTDQFRQNYGSFDGVLKLIDYGKY